MTEMAMRRSLLQRNLTNPVRVREVSAQISGHFKKSAEFRRFASSGQSDDVEASWIESRDGMEDIARAVHGLHVPFETVRRTIRDAVFESTGVDPNHVSALADQMANSYLNQLRESLPSAGKRS